MKYDAGTGTLCGTLGLRERQEHSMSMTNEQLIIKLNQFIILFLHQFENLKLIDGLSLILLKETLKLKWSQDI